MLTSKGYLFTDITVGWDQTSYTVSEGVGTFNACYSIVYPPSDQMFENEFFLRATTATGTAGGVLYNIKMHVITIFCLSMQITVTINEFVDLIRSAI